MSDAKQKPPSPRRLRKWARLVLDDITDTLHRAEYREWIETSRGDVDLTTAKKVEAALEQEFEPSLHRVAQREDELAKIDGASLLAVKQMVVEDYVARTYGKPMIADVLNESTQFRAFGELRATCRAEIRRDDTGDAAEAVLSLYDDGFLVRFDAADDGSWCGWDRAMHYAQPDGDGDFYLSITSREASVSLHMEMNPWWQTRVEQLELVNLAADAPLHPSDDPATAPG